jgi:hypothetical protein
MDDFARDVISFSIDTLCKVNVWSPVVISDMKQDLMKTYHRRMQQYSQHKNWTLKEGENVKGTLLGEFGNIIAGIANHDYDVRYIVASYSLGMNSLDNLGIKMFVQNQFSHFTPFTVHNFNN